MNNNSSVRLPNFTFKWVLSPTAAFLRQGSCCVTLSCHKKALFSRLIYYIIICSFLKPQGRQWSSEAAKLRNYYPKTHKSVPIYSYHEHYSIMTSLEVELKQQKSFILREDVCKFRILYFQSFKDSLMKVPTMANLNFSIHSIRGAISFFFFQFEMKLTRNYA